MSAGTLRLQDGSLKIIARDETVDDGVFLRGNYLDDHTKNLWTRGIGLPKDALKAVNEQMGRLARAFMEASFVSSSTAISAGGGAVKSPGLNYTSSLLDRDAAAAISTWFPEALRAVIEVLPGEMQAPFNNYAEVLATQSVKEPTFHASDAIVVGGGVVNPNQLDRVQLIEPQVAIMIDAAFESGVAAVIEKMLRHIGCTILQRARLSEISLHNDVIEGVVPVLQRFESVLYSTLDVFNCIKWLKKATGGGDSLIGILVSLPEATREKVFSNLENARAVTEAPTESGAHA